jgi:hypothetical protein
LNGATLEECAWEDFLARDQNDPSITLVKSHRLPEDGCPALVMERDGRCSILSHFRYLKRYYPQNPTTLHQLIEGTRPSGPWSDYVNAWRASENRVKLSVRYEKLIRGDEDTLQQIHGFFSDLGHRVRLPKWSDIQRSIHELNPQFLENRVVEWGGAPDWGWRENLLFYRLHGKTLRDLGYGVGAPEKWFPMGGPALIS